MKKITTFFTALLFVGAANLAFAVNDYGQRAPERGQPDGCHYMPPPPCDRMAPPPCHGMKGPMQKMSDEDRQKMMQKRLDFKIQRMTQRLDLTEKQQTEVRKVLQDAQTQKQAIRQQTKEKLDKILTKEQQEKMQPRRPE